MAPWLVSHASGAAGWLLDLATGDKANDRQGPLRRADPPASCTTRAEGPIFGLGIIEELRRHGYEMSAGLYIRCCVWFEKGATCFHAREQELRARRIYEITEPGSTALDRCQIQKVKERCGEADQRGAEGTFDVASKPSLLPAIIKAAMPPGVLLSVLARSLTVIGGKTRSARSGLIADALTVSSPPLTSGGRPPTPCSHLPAQLGPTAGPDCGQTHETH